MSKKDAKRAEIAEKLASHVIGAGMADTGLRRLAEVAGTSDRMLLYYFDDKEDLIATVLTRIGAGLGETLSVQFGSAPKPPAEVLRFTWSLVKSDAVADQLRLWLDLSSLAGRGDAFYAGIVDAIAEGWIEMISALLDVPKEKQRPLAILMMAAVDGQVVLFPGDPSKGDAAIEALSRLLEAA
ncbi:MAG: TetR/AcrR family transcriptional regulator [Parvibaculaceae bacterium]